MLKAKCEASLSSTLTSGVRDTKTREGVLLTQPYSWRSWDLGTDLSVKEDMLVWLPEY